MPNSAQVVRPVHNLLPDHAKAIHTAIFPVCTIIHVANISKYATYWVLFPMTPLSAFSMHAWVDKPVVWGPLLVVSADFSCVVVPQFGWPTHPPWRKHNFGVTPSITKKLSMFVISEFVCQYNNISLQNIFQFCSATHGMMELRLLRTEWVLSTQVMKGWNTADTLPPQGI